MKLPEESFKIYLKVSACILGSCDNCHVCLLFNAVTLCWNVFKANMVVKVFAATGLCSYRRETLCCMTCSYNLMALLFCQVTVFSIRDLPCDNGFVIMKACHGQLLWGACTVQMYACDISLLQCRRRSFSSSCVQQHNVSQDCNHIYMLGVGLNELVSSKLVANFQQIGLCWTRVESIQPFIGFKR